MPFHPSRVRSGALATTLLALLPGRSATSAFVAAPQPWFADPLAPRASSFVPYPQSLHFLGVLEGTEHALPPFRPTSWPDEWDGLPAFDPESSAQVLALRRAGMDRDAELLVRLRELAIQGATLSMPAVSRSRGSGAQEFQRVLRELERIALNTRLRGVGLLDGSTDVVLFLRPPGRSTLRLPSEDLTVSTLGLSSVYISGLTNAQAALDLIDTALDVVTLARTRLAVEQREFAEGTPEGGLIEVQRVLRRMRELAKEASDGTLNTGDRGGLDLRFQSDVARIRAVAEQALDGQPLLQGGLVFLQGAPPSGTTRFFELPDTRPGILGLSTDITTATNAAAALAHIEDAFHYVTEQRAALQDAREWLEDGRLHLR